MTTIDTITTAQIAAFRTAAVEAGDLDAAEVCTAALADGNVVIRTAKGSHVGSVREVCAWQAEMQGAAATIGGMDVSAIDFDADDIGLAIRAVHAAAKARAVEFVTADEAMVDGE